MIHVVDLDDGLRPTPFTGLLSTAVKMPAATRTYSFQVQAHALILSQTNTSRLIQFKRHGQFVRRSWVWLLCLMNKSMQNINILAL